MILSLSKTLKTSLAAVMAATMISETALAEASPEEPKLVPVDRDVIILFDRSYSIDAMEYLFMMRSIADALLSEESRKMFDSGLTYRISTGFYGGYEAIPGEHAIIRNSSELEAFVAKAIWDPVTDKPYPSDRMRFTSTGRGLGFAMAEFDRAFENGYGTNDRAVIILGDGIDNIDNPYGPSETSVARLAQDYNAVVYPIPIIIDPDRNIWGGEQPPKTKEQATRDLINFYCEKITTPAGLEYDGIPVKEGECIPAETYGDVGPAVWEALRLNMF